MRIGIDIDGVLNSQYNFCIDYGTKFCNELRIVFFLQIRYNEIGFEVKKGLIYEKTSFLPKFIYFNYYMSVFFR